jgi:hypothetical protein
VFAQTLAQFGRQDGKSGSPILSGFPFAAIGGAARRHDGMHKNLFAEALKSQGAEHPLSVTIAPASLQK